MERSRGLRVQANGAGDGQPHACDGRRESEEDGEPLEPERRHGVGDGEDRDPEHPGERFDSFAVVEHRTVPGPELSDHAQVDEAVVSDPPVRPACPEEPEPGCGQHRDLQGEAAA
ncbi:MAG: hypothetical protein KatS3mg010_0540 [Acidimicrobiia bacterium]|nr:MAG: hypothetical protein KatS3mg010_0540 [Acidimicrobiia bacterium]